VITVAKINTKYGAIPKIPSATRQRMKMTRFTQKSFGLRLGFSSCCAADSTVVVTAWNVPTRLLCLIPKYTH